MDAFARRLPPRYDPLASDLFDDPYPVYARLREAGPLCRGGPGQWVVTRHEDVARLLRSPTLSSEYPPAQRAFVFGDGSANTFYERIVLYRDAPAHGRLRAFLRQALTPSQVEAVAGRLPTMLAGLLKPALDGAPFDLVRDFAIPLSFRVMADVLRFEPGGARGIQRRALG